MTTYLYVYVNASNSEEAMEIASDMDGGDFIPYDQGIFSNATDWEIADAFVQEA
jgi:hypothetical protein